MKNEATANDRKVPTLYLEKLALGELSPQEQAFLDQRYSKVEQQEQAQVLRQKNAVFFASNSQETITKNIRLRLIAERPSRLQVANHIPLFAAAACLMLAFVWGALREKNRQLPDTLLKGHEPHVLVYRKLTDDYERLSSGALTHAGDLLQVRYVSAGYAYGVIFSIDGRGKVILHFPAKEDLSTKLMPRGEVALPFSYELDDAPLFERFFFVASNAPLSPEALLAKAKEFAADPNADVRDPHFIEMTSHSAFILRKPSHDISHD